MAVIAFILPVEVIAVLECLNKSLQKWTETIACGAVYCVRSTVQVKRSETSFHAFYGKAVEMVEYLGIDPIQVPFQRSPLKRYTAGPVKPVYSKKRQRNTTG